MSDVCKMLRQTVQVRCQKMMGFGQTKDMSLPQHQRDCLRCQKCMVMLLTLLKYQSETDDRQTTRYLQLSDLSWRHSSSIVRWIESLCEHHTDILPL
jgi:hypothetical protein